MEVKKREVTYLLCSVMMDCLVIAIQLHGYNWESGHFLTWTREMLPGAGQRIPCRNLCTWRLETLIARFSEYETPAKESGVC